MQVVRVESDRKRTQRHPDEIVCEVVQQSPTSETGTRIQMTRLEMTILIREKTERVRMILSLSPAQSHYQIMKCRHASTGIAIFIAQLSALLVELAPRLGKHFFEEEQP